MNPYINDSLVRKLHYALGYRAPSFSTICYLLEPANDAEFARLIEADARAALSHENPATIDRYADCVTLSGLPAARAATIHWHAESLKDLDGLTDEIADA